MKIAVLRVRGIRKVDPKIRKTFELLRLQKPNHCVLVDDSPQTLGMLSIVKDYVTYGPVDEETISALLYKRGRKGAALLRSILKEEQIKEAAKSIFAGKKTVDYVNPVFRLNPPSKGHKNIKANYPEGSLGKRESMSILLRKMM
ncbi:50S ribosomal protein L30 [Candidatus Bilamarchaeum dharawalense]|uniref:50S ribosomal protein L30 n=1 Tax=Candidatus Bilamarchaeum dharawalense TaxID=2885759 RepID=A0A5E4LRG5_9ARCH|nr:50S ribosomal protein L30 [Candidatus Bilamarchaeum dharawalense]